MPDEPKPEGRPAPPSGDAAVPGDQPAAAQPQPVAPKAPAAPAAPKPPAAPAPPKAPPVMVTTPWEDELSAALKEHFGDSITQIASYVGQNFLVAQPDAVIPILEYLKLEADFDYLVDLTAVDYPKKPERFELVYILYSFSRNTRVRVKAAVAEGAEPPTATTVYLTADWLEREVYDMFGVKFAGHPNMIRILMPDEWEGHPLRKDYPILKQDERWVKENLGIESGQ